MKKAKKALEPIEINFRNEPSEILDCETFDQVCLDTSMLMRKLDKDLKKISKKHGVSLSSEIYFRLEK